MHSSVFIAVLAALARLGSSMPTGSTVDEKRWQFAGNSIGDVAVDKRDGEKRWQFAGNSIGDVVADKRDEEKRWQFAGKSIRDEDECPSCLRSTLKEYKDIDEKQH